MNNLDVFNNSSIILERKIPPKIISWITIMILSLIIFLSISLFYKYHKYLYYLGTVIVEDKNYYIKLYIDKDKIPNFSNNELFIDNIKTKYQIKKISEHYYLTENKKKFYEVYITCLLDKKIIMDNNLIELVFKMPKTTIMQEIMKKIKKELR
ncbi:MAG: hypothetical protein GX247_05235 [Mollicutes bacterium]|nr:hypothetical protein [Mollicutes bacterium]